MVFEYYLILSYFLEDDKKVCTVAPAPPRVLSEEEQRKILMSEEFNVFFNRTSKIVERALSETVDLFTDYTGADELNQDK